MQVNMQEAEASLSKLGELAWQGEEIIIAKAGKPFLRLTPCYEESAQRRLSGALRWQIWIAPDFDDTPEELIDLFYNGEVFPEETSGYTKEC